MKTNTKKLPKITFLEVDDECGEEWEAVTIKFKIDNVEFEYYEYNSTLICNEEGCESRYCTCNADRSFKHNNSSEFSRLDNYVDKVYKNGQTSRGANLFTEKLTQLLDKKAYRYLKTNKFATKKSYYLHLEK